MDEQAYPEACSFCRKTAEDVQKLIAGEGVAICDECVDVCVDIIKDSENAVATDVQGGDSASQPRPSSETVLACTLCRMPFALDEMLLIEGMGALCHPCVSHVRAASDSDAGDNPTG